MQACMMSAILLALAAISVCTASHLRGTEEQVLRQVQDNSATAVTVHEACLTELVAELKKVDLAPPEEQLPETLLSDWLADWEACGGPVTPDLTEVLDGLKSEHGGEGRALASCIANGSSCSSLFSCTWNCCSGTAVMTTSSGGVKYKCTCVSSGYYYTYDGCRGACCSSRTCSWSWYSARYVC